MLHYFPQYWQNVAACGKNARQHLNIVAPALSARSKTEWCCHLPGLRGRKVKPKVVLHHKNTDNPEWCFVKKYRELCPLDAPPHEFYLQPSRHLTSSCWYSNRSQGHTTLGKNVSRICKCARIEGYKTNHSLHATSTTRLYQSGVDEQRVMERTGHRSLEGVRSYKRTSDSQRQALSDNLNRQVTQHHTTFTTSTTPPASSHLVQSAHSQLLQGLSLPSATFQNCTVNFNVGTVKEPSRKRKRVMILDDSDSDWSLHVHSQMLYDLLFPHNHDTVYAHAHAHAVCTQLILWGNHVFHLMWKYTIYFPHATQSDWLI